MQRQPRVTRHTENLTRIASRAWVFVIFTRKWYYGRIGVKKWECGSEYQSKRKSIYRILNICFIICMRWDKSPVCRGGTEGPSWGASVRRDSWMNKSKLWHCWLIHAELWHTLGVFTCHRETLERQMCKSNSDVKNISLHLPRISKNNTDC